MLTKSRAFTQFATKQLDKEETTTLKAGGEADTNPLYEASTQQGENPLHGG